MRSAFCFVCQSEADDDLSQCSWTVKSGIGSHRYEDGGGLVMRSAFCFVCQSEADDDLSQCSWTMKGGGDCSGMR